MRGIRVLLLVGMLALGLGLAAVPSAVADDPVQSITCDEEGDCWIDTDVDGVRDHEDNCKVTYNPGQEDNDHDGAGNVCDDTPDGSGPDGQPLPPGSPAPTPPAPDLNEPLVPGAGTQLAEEAPSYQLSFSWLGWSLTAAWVRCKTQRYEQAYQQAGLFDVLKIQVGFRVCYTINTATPTIRSFRRDDPRFNPNPQVQATFVRYPWEWHGLDGGFPNVQVYEDRVEMVVQGEAQFCVFTYGCGPARHPWVKIVFHANNTMSVTSGVL
jgi:hypothetical protein